MNLSIITNALKKLNVSWESEDGSITFDHPACPETIRCIVSWSGKDNLVMFVANYDLILPTSLSEESFAKMLNDSNYKSWRGSLEYDGEDTLIYRSATFLPPDPRGEQLVFELALNDFLKLARARIEKIRIRLKYSLQKESPLFSKDEADRFFSEQIMLMEKELDSLYSSSCTLAGAERSERIRNTEYLIRLFLANLSGNDRPGQGFDRSNFNTRR